MDTQRAAEIQAVLEGIALPATRAQLIAYAHTHDPAIARDLAALPDAEFDRLDAVGEALAPVRPARHEEQPLPRPESGEPPGGRDYLDPSPADAGRVRDDAPPSNPPQQAIEHASQTLKQQAARS